jgi:hypothetical protein
MSQGAFDPAGFYEFDLARGAVRTRAGTRVIMLSDDVLAPLVSATVQRGDMTALRRLGQRVGEQAAELLGPASGDAEPETVLSHAAGCVALFGFGRLRFEQWGDALVATLEGEPLFDADRLGVAALLGGVMTALAGRDVACVPAGKRGQFVVVDPSVAPDVFTWAKAGADVASIVAKLAPGHA